MNQAELGLKRGTVKLVPHQKSWEDNAKQTKNRAVARKRNYFSR